MSKFVITYDNKPPRNYAALYLLLASWNATRLADSVWLVDLIGPAWEVRDIVRASLQPNDVVAVLELEHGADWATSNAPPAASGWLAANVAPAQMAA